MKKLEEVFYILGFANISQSLANRTDMSTLLLLRPVRSSSAINDVSVQLSMLINHTLILV